LCLNIPNLLANGIKKNSMFAIQTTMVGTDQFYIEQCRPPPFSALCCTFFGSMSWGGKGPPQAKVLFIPRAQRLGSGQIVARAGYTFFNFRGRSEPFFDRCRRYLYSNRFLWSCQAVCNRLRCLQIFAGSAVQRCWTILLAERRCGGGRFSLSYFVFSSAAILARAIMKIITP
jgi:hypothetical protein